MGSPRVDVVFRLWQCDKENHGWREGPPVTVLCQSFRSAGRAFTLRLNQFRTKTRILLYVVGRLPPQSIGRFKTTIRPEAANLTGHLVSLLPAFVAPCSTYPLGFPGWTCVCFTFSIWRMTIIKTSTSYFACPSPATTAANLSSIWFHPST